MCLTAQCLLKFVEEEPPQFRRHFVTTGAVPRLGPTAPTGGGVGPELTRGRKRVEEIFEKIFLKNFRCYNSAALLPGSRKINPTEDLAKSLKHGNAPAGEVTCITSLTVTLMIFDK